MQMINKDEVRNLVFSGGGILGIAYVGVLKYLEEMNCKEMVENVAGASAGSMMALLVNLGYSSKEVEELYKQTDFKQFLDSDYLDLTGLINGEIDSYFSLTAFPETLRQLLQDNGICKGEVIYKFMQNCLINKGFDPHITFQELYRKIGKGLYIVNCNLSTHSYVLKSHRHSPKAEVAKSCLASVSIPLLYKPVYEDETHDTLCDGGVTNNYPITLFNTLGFYLKSKKDTLKPEHQKIDNLFSYLLNLLATFRKTSIIDHFKKTANVDKTVFIDTGDINFLNFELTNTQREFLINNAYRACEEYFEK